MVIGAAGSGKGAGLAGVRASSFLLAQPTDFDKPQKAHKAPSILKNAALSAPSSVNSRRQWILDSGYALGHAWATSMARLNSTLGKDLM